MTTEFFVRPDLGPGRVLVVDDDVRNRKLLHSILETQGHAVALAEDGPQALDMALSTDPHVILLDVIMPKMDGFEVCRRIKSDDRTASVPVLIITAMTERADRMTGIAAGADDFLTKPIDREELVLRVRNAVYGKQLYDELAKKYEELKAASELRDALTTMIDADTEARMIELQENGTQATVDGLTDIPSVQADPTVTEGHHHGTH